MLVASNLVKCLVTREAVRPGQDSKWARSMAGKKVYGTGLYIATCRNMARSSLAGGAVKDGAVGSVNCWFRSDRYCPKSISWVAFSNNDDLPDFVYLDVILCE